MAMYGEFSHERVSFSIVMRTFTRGYFTYSFSCQRICTQLTMLCPKLNSLGQLERRQFRPTKMGGPDTEWWYIWYIFSKWLEKWWHILWYRIQLLSSWKMCEYFWLEISDCRGAWRERPSNWGGKGWRLTKPCLVTLPLLIGGLEHFIFSHILGIIIPID